MPNDTPAPDRLSPQEIHRLIHQLVGVTSGYLVGFSYQTHVEFYPRYCDLDIDPMQYQGTTRDRFEQILRMSDGATQAKIVAGILKKFPIESFPDEERGQKQRLIDEYTEIVARLQRANAQKRGIDGEIKNLIFAANGPKPEIVLIDATLNTVQIVKNAEHCLIYGRDIPDTGLFWRDLVNWWSELNGLQELSHREQQQRLFVRLTESISDNQAELRIFRAYYRNFIERLGDNLPALIPQVYLHYDPYTTKQLGGKPRLPRQRMDFLLLLPNRQHIVLEIDGIQHYADDNNVASPKKYADMVAGDRQLKLQGYELYRFGGYELMNDVDANAIVTDFFERLLKKYRVLE